jgi:hypothetical protein
MMPCVEAPRTYRDYVPSAWKVSFSELRTNGVLRSLPRRCTPAHMLVRSVWGKMSYMGMRRATRAC